MNKGMLTVGVIMLAIMGLILINIISNYSTGSELDYYLVKEEGKQKLITSKVLVMGAGGLGSGVIMNLAAFGVGQIKIIDDDIVEEETEELDD